jgi:hypothetical protein
MTPVTNGSEGLRRVETRVLTRVGLTAKSYLSAYGAGE